MSKDLIDKLKVTKKNLQNSIINNKNIKNKPVEEHYNFKITISAEKNIYKVEISDYISISDYIQKMKSSDEFRILHLICNSVLWNSDKQKVNKGTYYVITIDNGIYNILLTEEKIKINKRTKIKIDEQTQKENITQERVITFDINNNEYHYFSAKHDKIGNTFYTRYYSKNRLFSLGALDLSREETYDEIKSIIYNLESIEGIQNILDVQLLKDNILDDLCNNSPQRKKTL